MFHQCIHLLKTNSMRRIPPDGFKLKFQILNKLTCTSISKSKLFQRILFSHRIGTLVQIVFFIQDWVNRILKGLHKVNRIFSRILEILVRQQILIITKSHKSNNRLNNRQDNNNKMVKYKHQRLINLNFNKNQWKIKQFNSNDQIQIFNLENLKVLREILQFLTLMRKTTKKLWDNLVRA